MIKFFPLFVFLLAACGATNESIQGTWISAYSEIIFEGKITKVGGFETATEDKLIFTSDSMQIVNSSDVVVGTATYETRNDTLLLEDGIQIFTFRISEDTLRLTPVLPAGTVTRVLFRE
jgi:hypothetical protein